MALTVVAAYDVSQDDRRARLAALLQSMGDRIQRSVFVLNIDAAGIAALEARVREIIDVDRDSFYLVRQCADCWENLTCIGQANVPDPVLYWSVW